MTKKLFALVILLLVSIPAFAQVDTAWVRRYNGPGNGNDWASGIATDDSGNVYVTGESEGSGTYYDYATVKYDPYGNEVWVRRYNGPVYEYDKAYAIAVEGSGYVQVTGVSMVDYETFDDCVTIKYDTNGNQLWVRRYDYLWSNNAGYDIAIDGSGNVYVTGQSWDTVSSMDYTTMKYDPNGTQLWVRRYTGPDTLFGYDFADAIAVDGSGNVYVTGSSSCSGTGSDYATIKYGPNGNELWVRRYNGPANSGDRAYAIAVDGSGYVYVTGESEGSGTSLNYATIKYNPDGNELWVTRYNGSGNWDNCAYAIAVDNSGKVYVTGSAGTIKYDANGNTLWIDSLAGSDITLDSANNVYVTGAVTRKYDSDGHQLWVGSWGGSDIALDSSNNVYVAGSTWNGINGDYATIKYVQCKVLILKDGSATHDSIPNKSFIVYKVHNDPPTMTQDSLGMLTTDSLGRMCLPKDWFKVGDSVKVERLVDTVKAVKHKSILKNMYYIKIDNGKFDTTTGAIYYDTLTSDAEQEVIVGHTTVMYDLLVSVEWDADQQYLQSLLDGFRYASNYLYDVTDGQLYLNIVRIYDNKKWWDSADVWIHGSNMRWPEAWVGDRELEHGIFGSGNEQRLFFPRIFYFNSYDGNRNLTYDDNLYPYDWTIAQTSYDDNHNGTIEYPKEYKAYPPSRTLAHEFGHYGIGFFDEYCRCPCREGGIDDVFPGNGTADYNFGLMDDQLKVGVAQNSEMSCSTIQYSDRNRRVTCQWTGREDRSCWDYFQWNFQKTYSGVFAAVKVPRTQMFAGPNDDMQNLDYDVGRLIPSAGAINDCLGGARTVIATLFDQNADPLPKAKVDLKKFDDTDSSRVIEQGETADSPYAGQIRCLGYNNWDQVLGSSAIVIEGKGKRGWLFGEGQIGKSGLSSFQNTYRSSLDGDSLDLFLRAVIGDYPLTHATSLSTGTPEYVLYASRLFFANPTLELHSDGNPAQIYTLQATPTGYSISIPDEIGISGMFTLLALDDSAYTFFVNTPYCLTQIVDTAFAGILIGPQGGCKLYLDNLNSSLEKILILSSPYPPIRIGLDPLSEQAGEVYSLSSYPSGSLLGSNSLIIRYADSDLHTQSEATLGVFKWNETLQMWESLCGFVDTLNNVVGASIKSLGVYAAFTTGYLRGDANGDGMINAADVVYLINYLFIHGPAPLPLAAGDVDCDGTINASDVVYLINYLFISGPPPCK